MVYQNFSTEILKRTDTGTSENDTIAEETNMTFHNDNSEFHFCGPQFIVNSKGNALNLELDLHDYEDTQNESEIRSSITVHPFHGGDTQQWLVHDDGNGGAALLSKYNRKYVVPTPNGMISSGDAPHFWKISRQGQGYSFGMESSGSNLYLCLVNNTVILAIPGIGYTPIYLLRTSPENYAAVRKSEFMTSLPDAHISAPGGIQENATTHVGECQTVNPAFPELAMGLPPDHILDVVATGRECSGFPTGFFRIRASGSSLYWTLHRTNSTREGNALGLWGLVNEEDAQAFYIDTRGQLCLCGGYIDASGNALILTKARVPTVPWPNPWSHPMPTFSYSEETECITVKFYADPCIPRRWPRDEKEWKEKEFALAAQCTEKVSIPGFSKISRWAPNSRFVMWTDLTNDWTAAHLHTMGVEEKPQLTDPEQGYPTRFRWELEEV